MSKNKVKEVEYDLKDFIWEEEEFTFNPKNNRHRTLLNVKRKQRLKDKMTADRNNTKRGIFKHMHKKMIADAEAVINGEISEEDYEDFYED